MKTTQEMKNTAMRFLNVSLVLVSLFCALIFIIQTVCMNMMGSDAIRQLGVTYMSDMSKQVASHFGTLIELRLSQVESLADFVPPGRFSNGLAQMQIELTYNARSIGFEYLALYTKERQFQMIYGSQVVPEIPEALHKSVLGGKYNVCAGKDAEGNPVVLMGVPAAYPTENGDTSIALVAGFPLSYLSDTLESNIDNGMMEYSIIRSDGSYVLYDGAAKEDNYFTQIEKHYETYNKKNPAQYAAELKDALEHGRDYTSEVKISGERWNIYCTSLPNSEWLLLVKTSHNALDEIVFLLQERWTLISLGGCALIICALLLVFLGYYRLTGRQIYELNEARKSAERSNRAKNEFLSNMSHDIRTPMNGIMGMTTIAIESLDNTPRVRSCLKRINVSSRHLLGLINDMLDMSKIESGMLTLHMEPLSIREIAQNIMTIIQPMVQEKNQHFAIYIHDVRHEHVISDRVRLSQILLNILGNAIKFTPENGTIETNLYEDPSPKGDSYIRSRLHIRDNGIGMSKEFMNRIFDPFSREDCARVEGEVGGGMGMTITKHIVDSMGGTITVESEQGKGSEFCVVIDMEKSGGQNVIPQLPHKNVLVIDHDVTANRIAVSALESIGLSADFAFVSEQAFQMMEECQGKGDGYHIILLTWDMPDADGIQIAKEIRRRFGNDMFIILLSDGEWDDLETAAKEAGVNEFLAKPLFYSSLYQALLPFAELETHPKKQQENSAADLSGKRILVAEDNELNWEIVREMLSDFGMELDWAKDGQVCAEKFVQSAEGWYDAILMDLRMPVMTGYDAAVAIRSFSRKDAKRIPIIAVSADAFADDIQKCFDCGMNAHSAKPFNLPEIIKLLEQYIF